MKPVSFVGVARCGRTGDVSGNVLEIDTCIRSIRTYHISILQKLLQTHPSIPELQLTFDFLRKLTLKNQLLFFHVRSSETPTAIRKEMTLEELDALLAKRKEDRRKEGDASRVHGGCSEAIHY